MSEKKPKAQLDWGNLKFEYEDVNCYMKCVWKDGAWGALESVEGSPYITMHVGATALHYGQALFEGLKAFACKDGKIRVFRPEENAHRMASSSARTLMPIVPTDLFVNAVLSAVRNNADFVPPYGTGASLYIRPLLLGTGPCVGLKPSKEYTFMVIVTPVGDYYKAANGASAMIMDDFDRAASLGMGSFKVAGNYVAALLPNEIAARQGHPITLFLDPIHHRYIEEFNSSNFIAVTKDGTYITPASSSILPSITNKSLIQLAQDEGIKVEQRQIDFEEEVGSFVEAGAVGTAVIITPVNRIVRGSKVHEIGGQTMGPILSKLYKKLSGIRVGEEVDQHGWMVEI